MLNFSDVQFSSVLLRALKNSCISYLVQGPYGSEPESRFWWATEQLKHRDSRGQLLGGSVLQIDDGVSRLIYHNLTLVSEAVLNKVKHWAVRSVKYVGIKISFFSFIKIFYMILKTYNYLNLSKSYFLDQYMFLFKTSTHILIFIITLQTYWIGFPFYEKNRISWNTGILYDTHLHIYVHI